MPLFRAGQEDMVIEGQKAFKAAIRELGDKGTKRVVAAGIRAGLTVLTGAIRVQIAAVHTNTPNEGSLRYGMRKLVRSRFRRRSGTKDHEAIVGFGVGLKGSKRLERMSKETTHGVGVSGTDVHWFALTGRSTPPQMKPHYEGVVRKANDAAGEDAMSKTVSRMKQRISAEAAKARMLRIRGG